MIKPGDRVRFVQDYSTLDFPGSPRAQAGYETVVEHVGDGGRAVFVPIPSPFTGATVMQYIPATVLEVVQ